VAESIPANPENGRIVPELSITQIRDTLYKNYSLAYVLKKNSIYILIVLKDTVC
jgi:hypothetical protein